jgi:phosphoglycolate phosphatase
MAGVYSAEMAAEVPTGFPRNQRAVLFDLDGTLTDPKPGITRCIQHAMKELGHAPPEADALHWCIGPPLRGSFERLLGSSDAELLDRALAHYRQRFSVVGLFENSLYPEAPGAVSALRALGYRTFVVTAKPQVFAMRIVDHFSLSGLFERVHGSELDGRRTDKGDLIAHVLAQERLDPSRVVMVGDREHDAIGAARCAVRCIGVTYGYGTESELLAQGVTRLAGSPRDIVSLVEGLFGNDARE